MAQPAPEEQVVSSPVTSVTANLEDNMELSKPGKPGSIVWWGVIFAVYLFWDWFQTRDKVQTAIEPKNVRANLHNLVVVTFAAVIGINALNVFFTKLAAMRIPVVSRMAGTLLPLFHL